MTNFKFQAVSPKVKLGALVLHLMRVSCGTVKIENKDYCRLHNLEYFP